MEQTELKIAGMNQKQIIKKWPRITAHIIAESLGYATPESAALILKDAALRQPNYCEWIDACYRGDARRALQNAIRNRHHHRGYMADYRQALAIVQHVNAGNRGPDLASWF